MAKLMKHINSMRSKQRLLLVLRFVYIILDIVDKNCIKIKQNGRCQDPEEFIEGLVFGLRMKFV